MMPDISAAMDAFMDQLYSGFTPEEQRLYADMFARIARNAEKELQQKT
jgi:DNA replication initiation complex subunit (GINS family)